MFMPPTVVGAWIWLTALLAATMSPVCIPEPDAAKRAAPQDRQNLALGETAASHCRQIRETGISLPQFWQYFPSPDSN